MRANSMNVYDFLHKNLNHVRTINATSNTEHKEYYFSSEKYYFSKSDKI